MTLQLLERAKRSSQNQCNVRSDCSWQIFFCHSKALGWTHSIISTSHPHHFSTSGHPVPFHALLLSKSLNNLIFFQSCQSTSLSFPYRFDDLCTTFIWWQLTEQTVLDLSKWGSGCWWPHTSVSLRSINVCADWREGGKFLSCKLAALLGSLPPKLKACVESLAEALTARKEGNGEKAKGN